MKKINALLYSRAYFISIFLFLIALLIDVISYAGSVVLAGFSAYNLAFLIFEVVLHCFLIYALARKKEKLSNLIMVLIKGFDAVSYTILIGLKIDKYLADPSKFRTLSYINLISYGLSALLLITILVLFCLSILTKEHKYWKVMKISMIITCLIMFICSICEIVNFVKYSSHWYEFLEPIYLFFLISGMFVVCHYIEKDK